MMLLMLIFMLLLLNLMLLFLAGATVSLLDIIERTIQRLCPFVAGGIVVGSIFWSAVTYGAVTVMQVKSTVAQYKNF